MNKAKHHLLKIIPFLSGIALIFVLAGSVYMLLHSPDEKTDPEPENKSVASDEEQEEAKDAEKALVTLNSLSDKSNGWEYDILDDSIAELVSSSIIDIDKDLDEGQFKNRFTFQGIKEGETRVTFTYAGEEGDIDSADYIIYVDKNLNARAEKVEDIENTPEE